MNLKTRIIGLTGAMLYLLLGMQPLWAAKAPSGLEWSVVQQLELPVAPKSVLHSLDGKMTFFLTDHSVLVYDQLGKHKGTIPIEDGVSAIDIAPRGELLFLVNEKNKTYTAISINFIREINVAGSPYVGLENAAVTLVVFTDFQ